MSRGGGGGIMGKYSSALLHETIRSYLSIVSVVLVVCHNRLWYQLGSPGCFTIAVPYHSWTCMAFMFIAGVESWLVTRRLDMWLSILKGFAFQPVMHNKLEKKMLWLFNANDLHVEIDRLFDAFHKFTGTLSSEVLFWFLNPTCMNVCRRPTKLFVFNLHSEDPWEHKWRQFGAYVGTCSDKWNTKKEF